ncbi:hypothetical protein MPH_03973 [Macrophomina phaseolina MS6]|uniref:Uncharacterized protein n=1 Tax=Macrophomina phaseolina (strain MS6) TaxID=1126212 RepID=K2S1A5_MACPH|nr:hypothetical protein MPH_03973 [Macrophomina phaseolina MS6]
MKIFSPKAATCSLDEASEFFGCGPYSLVILFASAWLPIRSFLAGASSSRLITSLESFALFLLKRFKKALPKSSTKRRPSSHLENGTTPKQFQDMCYNMISYTCGHISRSQSTICACETRQSDMKSSFRCSDRCKG